MTETPPTPIRSTVLLEAVSRRATRSARLALACRVALVVTGVLAALLLVQRLCGFGPDVFDPVVLLLPPLGGIMVAWLRVPRAPHAAAARRVDAHAATDDLFLTRALLDRARGEYAPLVAEAAEARAVEVDAARVVPFQNGRLLGSVAAALGLLALGVLLLPQLDPFGDDDGPEQARRARSKIERQERTVQRAAALRKKEVTTPQSPEVQALLQEMTKILRQMKRTEPVANRTQLQAQQRTLGERWRDARQAGQRRSASGRQQNFGGQSNQRSRKMGSQLRQGESSAAKQAVQEIRQLAKKAAESKDQNEREKLLAEMRKRAQELRSMARNDAGSPELQQAVAAMLQELQAMELDGLSADALDALARSTELAELELDALAQSMRDLDALEEALKALQLAKMLNDLEGLDGEGCKDCQGVGDYAELYAKMMAERGGEHVCSACQGDGDGGT